LISARSFEVYVEKYHPFHTQLRYEREQRGWTQAELAEKVGCDQKTVGNWESGKQFPRPYHRQEICKSFGKTLAEMGLTSDFTTEIAAIEAENTAEPVSQALVREDLSEAPQIANLYGREQEYQTLLKWLSRDHCKVVTVLGMGGVGKTVLTAEVARQMHKDFTYIFWRTLQDAPPFALFMKQCLVFLSHQQLAELPEKEEELLAQFHQMIRDQRCLVILDNIESIMQSGQRAGLYREGYEAYGRLIKLCGEVQHESSLVLTSREKPGEVTHLEGKNAPVRSLQLGGLEPHAGQDLLRDKDLFGPEQVWRDLVDRYSGNPLALQLLSATILEVFAGDIARFLQYEGRTFSDINGLLDQQFQRLSAEEREIIYWLAIEREPTSFETLNEDMLQPFARKLLPDGLASLRRRSLIEARGPASESRESARFALQPVIMEYITERIIEQALLEFKSKNIQIWRSHALSKARSNDYVRESQLRLLLEPLGQHLLSDLSIQQIGEAAADLLAIERQGGILRASYLAGNLLNFLSYLRYDLRDFDFSHVWVQQAYLQNLHLRGVNFANAHFVATSFTNTFGNVLSVAVSPDGQLLAIGASTGEISLYQISHGTRLHTCQGHTDGVWSVTFSCDSRLLASGSDDQTVRIWDVNTGLMLHNLPGHTDRVRSVVFHPSSRLLVSGSDDQTVCLWDSETGHCHQKLLGHSGRVWSVAFDPAGELLATSSTDQTIRLWDVASTQCLGELQGHTNWIRSVKFSPDGSQLVSGSDDQTVRIWDVSQRRCLQTLAGHTNRVWSVAYSPDGQTVASGSEDSSVRIWDISTGESCKVLGEHTRGVRCVTFQVDGHVLISGSDDQTCRLWDTATGYCLEMLQGYTNRLWSVAFGLDEKRLVSLGEDEQIRLWDVASSTCQQSFQAWGHRGLAVAYSSDGSTLASGGEDQVVWIWDLNSGRCASKLRGHTNWIRSVAFSPDGSQIASGGEDRSIILWEKSTGRRLHTLQGHTNSVRAVSFSVDGSQIASGSDDRSIRIWDVSSGSLLRVLHGHSSLVRSVAFSPGGDLLASASEDQKIRLWKVSSGDCLDVLSGHTGRIRWVTFSPDGQVLASCSDDGRIKLWSMQSRACVKTLISERPYESMNITGVEGLTEAQRDSLLTLGAIA
jgi:WD40 repeat protein/transcriptional regulator with XRE-family HTH domain